MNDSALNISSAKVKRLWSNDSIVSHFSCACICNLVSCQNEVTNKGIFSKWRNYNKVNTREGKWNNTYVKAHYCFQSWGVHLGLSFLVARAKKGNNQLQDSQHSRVENKSSREVRLSWPWRTQGFSLAGTHTGAVAMYWRRQYCP